MRRFIDRIFSLIVASLLIIMVFALDKVQSDGQVSVVVNGKILSTDIRPVIEHNRILVPMRSIFEALGADVKWHQSTHEVEAVLGGEKISMYIGDHKAHHNGKMMNLDTPARIIMNHTFVPLRFVGESMGAKVEWDALNRKVNICTQDCKMDTDNTQRDFLKTISFKKAYDVYMKEYPNIKIYEMELEKENSSFIYVIEGFDSKYKYELQIDAGTSQILHKEKTLHSRESKDWIERTMAAKADDLIQSVVNSIGEGKKFKEINIETEKGRVVIEFEFINPSTSISEFKYDVDTGKLVD